MAYGFIILGIDLIYTLSDVRYWLAYLQNTSPPPPVIDVDIYEYVDRIWIFLHEV